MYQVQSKPRNFYTPEDIEYALGLLPALKPRRYWEILIESIVFWLMYGIFILGIIQGLIIIWFDTKIGLRFFLAAGLAIVFVVSYYILTGVLSAFAGLKQGERYTKIPEDDEINQIARQAVEPPKHRKNLLFAILLLNISIFGCVWMTYGLIKHDELGIPALLLLNIFGIFNFLILGYANFQDEKYKLEIQRIRQTLLTTQPDNISNKQFAHMSSILSQVENRYAKLAYLQSQKALEEGKWYSIAIPKHLGNLLNNLPDQTRDELGEAINNLQFDPYPKNAQYSPPNTYLLRKNAGWLYYSVDPEQKHIQIQRIVVLPEEESYGGS